jgi:hypothetical protein
MDANVVQLIQEAVEKGITSQRWPFLIILVVGAALAAFLGSYLKKKGEHRAQDEVSEKLLEQLIVQTRATEEIKGNIAAEVGSSTTRLQATMAEQLAKLQATLTQDVQFRIETLLPRLEAYKSLWAMTYVVRPTRNESITEPEKAKLREDMGSWYYNAGNGIFLSLDAGKRWRAARSSLEKLDDDKIKLAFSRLRTQLKVDIQVYEALDAETDLGS